VKMISLKKLLSQSAMHHLPDLLVLVILLFTNVVIVGNWYSSSISDKSYVTNHQRNMNHGRKHWIYLMGVCPKGRRDGQGKLLYCSGEIILEIYFNLIIL